MTNKNPLAMPERQAISEALPISILMSTYLKDEAWMLAASLASLYEQTRPPAQIVLVLDGPISQDSETVIECFTLRRPCHLTLVRLRQNRGLAHALNEGLRACRYDLVARMDADDLSHPKRLEKQWAFFCERGSQVDLLNTWAAEFSSSPLTPDYIKTAPADHDAIVGVLKYRNTLCHPAIMVRKATIEQVGGYSTSVGLMEDYDLFIRMIEKGARFASLQDALVFVRISPQQRGRRGGLGYLRKEWSFRWGLYRREFISLATFLWVIVVMTFFRLSNPFLKQVLYRFVRNKS
jgi:glycosyltransferase involved in cell wall biosynthesis